VLLYNVNTPWVKKIRNFAIFVHVKHVSNVIFYHLSNRYSCQCHKNFCKIHNIFIWLKVFFSNVCGSEKSQLWIGIGGSEKNRLWCVPNGMSGKQHHSKCSKLPPSARIHASSLFRHWPTASSTTLLKFSPCRHKTLPQLVRIANRYSIRVKKMKKQWC